MEVLVEGKGFNITDDVRDHINAKLSKISFAEDKVRKVHFFISTTPTSSILCELDIFVDHTKVFAKYEHQDWKIAITDAINIAHDLIIKERKKKKASRLREARKKRQ
ncbi:MAG: HPF/RaiA family ribosome-associated protein [Brevinematales bacterium]|nr:HPF/RaiA family ribosome-associated protein [Brevinematales bacterium]